MIADSFRPLSLFEEHVYLDEMLANINTYTNRSIHTTPDCVGVLSKFRVPQKMPGHTKYYEQEDEGVGNDPYQFPNL